MIEGDDPFFPRAGKEGSTILKYCFKCEVKAECGARGDALKVESGVWGGVRRSKRDT